MTFDAVVSGLPLVLVVLGLVEWIKSLGLSGTAVKIVSLMVGVAFGVGYQMTVALPSSFAGWFAAVVYGLGLGLVASGIYDAAKDATRGG